MTEQAPPTQILRHSVLKPPLRRFVNRARGNLWAAVQGGHFFGTLRGSLPACPATQSQQTHPPSPSTSLRVSDSIPPAGPRSIIT